MTLKSVVVVVNYENVFAQTKKKKCHLAYKIWNENWYDFLSNVVCTSMQLDFETSYAEE